MREGNGAVRQPQLTWLNIMATLALALSTIGGGWVLVQSQMGALERQFNQSISALSGEVAENKRIIIKNRDETIHRAEHTEFVKRVDEARTDLVDRLKVLESTRPTTGELQRVSGGVERDISEIKARLKSLEDNLRSPTKLQSP